MSELLKRSLSGLVFLIVFWGCFYLNQYAFDLLIFLVWVIAIFELKGLLPLTGLKFYLAAIAYPTMPFFFILLLNTEQYRHLLLIYFVTIFAFDTGSFVFGKVFGKHKICPVSPNKTWEGFFGGIIATIICLELYFQNILTLGLFIFSTIFGLLALTGDLFESWLKRKAGVKDSGKLIPGHGGVLDRFDAITLTMPFVYALKNYILEKLFI